MMNNLGVRLRLWLGDVKEAVLGGLLGAVRWLIWSPWRIGGAVAVLVVLLILVAQLQSRNESTNAAPNDGPAASPWPTVTAVPDGAGTSTPAPTTDAGGEVSTAAGENDSTNSAEAPPSTVPTDLSGEDLDRAWITAFLTRSDPASDAWVEAIGPVTTADLVSTLRAQADKLEIPLAGSWTVTKITPYTPPDPVTNSPARHSGAYIVTISSGQKSMDKPFIVTSYLSDEGWQVAVAEQPYSSNG